MINTINNSGYNTAKRRALWTAYQALAEARDAELDAADAIEDNNEWNEATADICNKYKQLVDKAIERCFYAQFPDCKNDWFINVINGLEKGKAVSISEKQYYAFRKYARYEDCDSWRNKTTYCCTNGYGVALTWKNAFRAITVVEL